MSRSPIVEQTMQSERRSLLRQAATCAAATVVEPALSASTTRIKAVAFDAFPVFDPRPINHLQSEDTRRHSAA
jgi:hypothetical protein